ncbi:unnamed protein product [Rotaria sordida]|uniref:Uncharacterized protein n=1 Tax=Rotaria sordida TaxID=392033 RepID=A0A818XT32_9BILA|nr:unnamed protein product [Rotaria sordida]
MVVFDNNLNESDSIQCYYGECDSLLANCCSKTHLSSTFKFRTMNRQRRQMAFEALRQMKLQQQTEIFSTRSKRRRNKKRFYRALCCTDLHISESQSSVYSSAMATIKSKSHIPSTGLTNEFYFVSHKPDGDNEKTPPVLMRSKHRSSNLQTIPIDNISSTLNNRRPISSPVRSTTYVLQQHHRVHNNNNNNNNINQKKISSPVHLPPSSATPMTLNKNRQIQQQRTNSNHEKLPLSTVDSTITNQHLTSRTHTVLTPRRTSPMIKNTPIKTATSTSRSPRIANTPPIRSSRPSAPTPPTPIQQRSPRIQLRPSNLTPTSQRTISSSPTTNKSIRPQYTLSKSPDKLRSANGTVTRPRQPQTIVKKSKLNNTNTTTNNIKTRTSVVVQSASSSVATPRVSDLDALMAEKHIINNNNNNNDDDNNNNNKTSHNIELKSTIIFPPPIVNNIRRSLFSTDSVKVVRPVRSQELKLFSYHLITEPLSLPQPSPASNEISCESNIDDTLSILTPLSAGQIIDNKFVDNEIIIKNDDASSITSVITRDLSEDSLNEHYHIRKLLNDNALTSAINNDNIQDSSSNEDIPVTSWSRIRSSCESNISHIVPLKSETSTSPALYNGPIRQEDIHMASDGRYFLLIDDNLSSEESQLNKTTSSSLLSRSISPLIKTSITSLKKDKNLIHRLVFPPRLGRILFYRRILSDSDIYQKLCSKDNEINHNVYHLDTIRDYSMEFYMLTTYASDSQLRAWLDSNYDDIVNNTCYFDDNRYQSLDDDDDDDDDLDRNQIKMNSSSDSIIREDDLSHLQGDEELDWYSELESFNISPNNPQWKHENVSSCSSEDHVGELLRAEQFSVSSLTTTTSADSSSSTGLISASWPLTNGINYQVHCQRSSQSLNSPPLSNFDDQSHTILKEILTYPWTNEISNTNINRQETRNDHTDNHTSSSIVPDEFQPDFYYLCPLKNTTSFVKTDEKSNGIQRQLSHDV